MNKEYKVDPEAQRRYNICSQCENNVEMRCQLCGCHILFLVNEENAECFANKWNIIGENDESTS